MSAYRQAVSLYVTFAAESERLRLMQFDPWAGEPEKRHYERALKNLELFGVLMVREALKCQTCGGRLYNACLCEA